MLGFENLMFPLRFALLGGSFVVLVLPFCSLFSPFFWGALVNLWLARFHLVGAFSIDPKNKLSSEDIKKLLVSMLFV
jgi:hypothetical protein